MVSRYTNEVSAIIDGMNQPPEDDKEETFHIYPVDGGIFVTRQELGKTVEAEKDRRSFPDKHSFVIFFFILCLFICLDSMDFYFTNLTSTAIITITLKEFSVSIDEKIDIVPTSPGKNQILGRTLFPLTLSQTKTIAATGRGHQDASYALGVITFYNGLLSSQKVPEGTIFTGSDGIEVETTVDAYIPPASPPIEGSVTVPARALKIGSSGNIGAKDINAPYGTGILAVNISSFSGGQDARDFTYVTKSDIESARRQLTRQVFLSAESAFSSQLAKDEELIPPTCTSTVSSNHQAGEVSLEATITVSEKCSALSYKAQDLQVLASKIAKAYVFKFRPTDYVPVKVKVKAGRATLKTITASVELTLIVRLNQKQIKHLAQGKSKAQALKAIASLSGIKQVSIGGADPLPLDDDQISIVILYPF